VAGEASGIRAGRAFVELAIHDLTEDGLNKAAARYKKFGRQVRDIGVGIGGFGAAIVGPLTAFATLSAKAGAEIYDMSKRTGIAVSTLSALGYAADQSGTDINTVEGALRRMQKSIAGVADEAEGTTGSLSELGIAASSIQGKNPAEQFNVVAAAIRKIPDATERAAAAQRVFGRSGTALLPLIENYQKLTADAQKFGFIRSDASAKSAKDLDEELNNAAKAGKSLASALGAAVMPALKQQAIFIREITLAVRDFVKDHQGAIAIVFKFGTVLTLLASVLAGVGFAIVGIGSALKTMRTALELAKGGWADLKSAVAFLAANPLLLVAAGVTAVAIAVNSLSDYTAELSTASRDAVAAGEEQREADQTQIARLRDLSTQMKLTAQEQTEAKEIIQTLSDHYGNLNITLDATTGKLSGVAAGLAEVNKAMREKAKLENENALAEAKKNLEKLNEEKIARTNHSTTIAENVAISGQQVNDALTFHVGKKGQQQQAQVQSAVDTSDIDRKIKLEQANVRLGEARAKAIAAAQAPAAGASGAAGAGAANVTKTAEEEKKAVDELNRSLQESHDSAVGPDAKAIDSVNSKLQEELKLIDELKEINRNRFQQPKDPNDHAAIEKAKADFQQLQRERVDAVRNAEAQIQRIQSQNASQKIEDVGAQLDARLRRLDVRQQAARGRGDSGEVAGIEAQRTQAIRAAEDQVRSIRKASVDQQLADARQASAAEIQAIDAAADAAKANGDPGAFQKLQEQRVAAVREATDKIAGILHQSAAEQASDDENRIGAIRQRLNSRVGDIDARKDLAQSNGDQGTVAKLEQERVAAVENAEREIRELRQRSAQEQIAGVQDSTRTITQEIERQKTAALGRGDVREFQKLEQDRVAAVADAEQQIAEIKKNAGDQQAADDARRVEDERRRQQEKVQKQQDATRFLLELQKELAEKQGGGKSAQSDTQKQQIAEARAAADEAERRRIAALKRGDSQGAAAALRDWDNAKQRASQLDATPAAKFLEKQLSSLEFEQRLTQLFGDNEAMKGRFRQLKEQIDAVPTIQHNAAGTFNAAAAQSLRGTPVEERTAKACEETARNTRDMTKKQPVYSR
jgi:hypothetical protein